MKKSTMYHSFFSDSKYNLSIPKKKKKDVKIKSSAWGKLHLHREDRTVEHAKAGQIQLFPKLSTSHLKGQVRSIR